MSNNVLSTNKDNDFSSFNGILIDIKYAQLDRFFGLLWNTLYGYCTVYIELCLCTRGIFWISYTIQKILRKEKSFFNSAHKFFAFFTKFALVYKKRYKKSNFEDRLV